MRLFTGSGVRRVLAGIKFIVKILVIVNESPWGSTLPAAALRFCRAVLDGGHEIEAVFFRGDGVYNAVPGRDSESTTPDLAVSWAGLAAPLLVCSSAAARRLDRAPGGGFREAGLAEVLERMDDCDRVVTF